MDGVTYGPEEAEMQTYLRAGEIRAYALGNRGPIRFTQTGALHPEILESYSRCGFYVFESVLRHSELADIERDLHDIRERLPVERGAAVDGRGRPALDCKAPVLHWARPLSDPWGGHGRWHPQCHRDLRRGAYPRTRTSDRVRYRCAPSALSRRSTVRLSAAC